MSNANEFVFPAIANGLSIGGLTKRELFAAVAMHAAILQGDALKMGVGSIAAAAKLLADATLKTLEESQDVK